MGRMKVVWSPIVVHVQSGWPAQDSSQRLMVRGSMASNVDLSASYARER